MFLKEVETLLQCLKNKCRLNQLQYKAKYKRKYVHEIKIFKKLYIFNILLSGLPEYQESPPGIRYTPALRPTLPKQQNNF